MLKLSSCCANISGGALKPVSACFHESLISCFYIREGVHPRRNNRSFWPCERCSSSPRSRNDQPNLRSDPNGKMTRPPLVGTVLAMRYKILETVDVDSFKAHDPALDQTVTVRQALLISQRAGDTWRQKVQQLASVPCACSNRTRNIFRFVPHVKIWRKQTLPRHM